MLGLYNSYCSLFQFPRYLTTHIGAKYIVLTTIKPEMKSDLFSQMIFMSCTRFTSAASAPSLRYPTARPLSATP